MSLSPPAPDVQVVAFGLGDAATRRRYDDLFERCPQAYLQQSTWWGEVIAPLGPDEPIFLLAIAAGEAVAGLPLYLYRHAYGPVLVSVPQAGPLGGIFQLPGLPPPLVHASAQALLRTTVRLARENDCVALSVIADPFAAELPAYEQEIAPTYRFENFTQWIDVRAFFAANGEVAFRDYNRRSNLSRNLAKARAAGFKVRQCTDPAELAQLYAIHVKRHAELQASPLDARLFENIARVLIPRKKAFILVVEAGSQAASWGVYLHHQSVLDVLRLNMDSDFADACPNFLNTDASLRLARDLGVTHYNWQSSPSRDSGVYRYKVQWSSTESTYAYLTRLFRPTDYLASLGAAALQAAYPLHFIAPYAATAAGFAPGVYRKD